MTNSFTIQEQVRKLEHYSCHEEQLVKTLEMYMNLFPVVDSFLLRYSPLGYLAEGIISINSSGMTHIREMRDDIRSLPGIHTAIRERKAKYYEGIEVLKTATSKYIFDSHVTSILIVPICYSSVVIGYICSNKFIEGIAFDDKLLSSFTLYGKLVGKVLENSSSMEKTEILSKRELEVMKRIAWGDSTKEMAYSLGISEFTIKQYVKFAIKKLGAQNRAQAVAELFRKGILS